MKRLIQAMHYAAHQHRRQRRKDAELTPYINHPITLLHILRAEADIADEDILIGAVLHDVIEDCSGPAWEEVDLRRAEIRERFGDEVLRLVEAVTDDKTITDKAERKRQQILQAAKKPRGAQLIKLADKTANLRDVAQSPPDWSLQRRQEYFDWAKQVVDQCRGVHPKLERLFDEAFELRP